MTEPGLKLAYADPPYFGYGKLYDDTDIAATREYDDLEAWERLAANLAAYDGWAVSMTSGNLHDLLPLFPGARVAAWVKPFAAFKRNVRIAYTWEPVLFRPGRDSSALGAPVGRDHLAESITMRKGLTGVKPAAFNAWVLDLIGWVPGDHFEDLFPGSGGMGEVVRRRAGIASDDEISMFEEELAL
jgi:hypothetical protein